MPPRNTIVMFKLARPKQISLPDNRSFTAQYRRDKRSDLPENIILRRLYKERSTLKNKRRHVRKGKGIGSTLKKIFKNPIIKKTRKESIKKSIWCLAKLDCKNKTEEDT